ncbi:MSMEG_1061 family FMN-dependent PPOX-type flavoprotein [Geodermatophilus sp. SYSU D00815]
MQTGPDVLASYSPPHPKALDKEIGVLDEHCRAFIALSPFVTLATTDADGWPEVSPRGGDPGFVRVLDDRRLVLPDRPGNNRVESLRNVAADPRLALMFLVPGIDESLRVYGAGSLVAAEDLDLDLTEFGRAPRSALVVEVRSAYFQCAKAVMRAGLWDPQRRVERSVFPTFSQVLRDHCADDSMPLLDTPAMRAALSREL